MLREEYARLRDKNPESLERELKEFAGTLLTSEFPEEAMPILDALYSHFPDVTHERDEELERRDRQLKVLQQEVHELRSRVDGLLQRKELGIDLGAELSVMILGFLYGEESASDRMPRGHPEDYAGRLTQSLKTILSFIESISTGLSQALYKLGAWKENRNAFDLVRDRVSQEIDPGPEGLDTFLRRLQEKLIALLAAHEKAAVEGGRKILLELAPENLEREAGSSQIKKKWETLLRKHSEVLSLKDKSMYKRYFDSAFQNALAKEDDQRG